MSSSSSQPQQPQQPQQPCFCEGCFQVNLFLLIDNTYRILRSSQQYVETILWLQENVKLIIDPFNERHQSKLENMIKMRLDILQERLTDGLKTIEKFKEFKEQQQQQEIIAKKRKIIDI